MTSLVVSTCVYQRGLSGGAPRSAWRCLDRRESRGYTGVCTACAFPTFPTPLTRANKPKSAWVQGSFWARQDSNLGPTDLNFLRHLGVPLLMRVRGERGSRVAAESRRHASLIRRGRRARRGGGGRVAKSRRTFPNVFGVSSGMRRFALIMFLAVVSSVFAGVGFQRASAGTPLLKPVQFAPAVGWHLRTGTVHSCPGVVASRCSQVTSTASTTRYRDCLDCLPHRTVAAMRANDIAIQITVALEHPMRVERTCAWPPRVTTRRVLVPFEGLPRRIGVYQCQSPVRRREVFIFIVFGRAIPTTRQLNLVNAELRRARLG